MSKKIIQIINLNGYLYGLDEVGNVLVLNNDGIWQTVVWNDSMRLER